LQVYHRREYTPGQTAAVAAEQEKSGLLYGRPAEGFRRSFIPKAKAYSGPLPGGERGIEFTTDAVPDQGCAPGLITWSMGTPGVEQVDDETVSIKIKVIRNTQK
jgi:hypothetical protein